MKSIKPVVNTFKKRPKSSRPARVHVGPGSLREDGLLAKKHAGGLRSPKGSSGRSPGTKQRTGRATLPRCESSASNAPCQTPRSIGTPARAASGVAPSSTKKRSRSLSRPPDPQTSGSSGPSIADEGQDGCSGSDRVKVFVRIRPRGAIDGQTSGSDCCLKQLSDESLAVVGASEATQFSYDHVAGPSVTQQKLFDVAGVPVVDNCLRGYNSCVFAYGQTGSGKTYTMLGDLPGNVDALRLPASSGLMPRIFQYLFGEIAKRQEQDPSVRYTCSCSLLEIYNETITDLLNTSSTNLQLRVDAARGVYAEDLTVETIQNAQHAMDMLRRGSINRRVADTNKNNVSSRSHCVLTCSIESKATDASGFTKVLSSRLNLVDLAGSERQKTSGAAGCRLREASSINRSLSTLGLVIMSLMDVQHRRKGKHVPYRDSKLTFLLQDSLGGNSKTVMIANVSPATADMHETISTLRFARRAKFVKNRAVVNEDREAEATPQKQEAPRKAKLVKKRGVVNEDSEADTTLRKQDVPRKTKPVKKRAVVKEDPKSDATRLKQDIARLNQTVVRYRVICETALNNSAPGVSGDGCAAMDVETNPPSERRPTSTASSRSMECTAVQPASSRSAECSGVQPLKKQSSADTVWESVNALDIQFLHARAQEAASKAFSDASRKIEEVFAKANREVRRKVREAARLSTRGQPVPKSAAAREDREKLIATLECNQKLQGQLLHLGQHVAGLTEEKALLEDRMAKKQSCIEHAEVRAEEALHEVEKAKDEVARLKDEKTAVEARLRAAAKAKEEIESRCAEMANDLRSTHQQLVLAVENNKDLHLKNKELEEQVMDIVAEKEDLLSKVKMLTASQQVRVCRCVEGEDEEDACCTCGIEIVQLQGQLQEEREKTYCLMRQLEILTLQQDEEFREEFGSCKDQLVTLLKKLEEATNELNLLKHTLIEKDSEVQDLQEYVVSYGGHCGQLEDELRAQVLAREDLLSKNKRLETELDNVRCAVQQGLEGGELLLVKSLQAELALLRQENSRLSKGTEGKDSEMASLRRELECLKAVASMHQVSEVKPRSMEAALSQKEVAFVGAAESTSPQEEADEWEVEEDCQQSTVSSQLCFESKEVGLCEGVASAGELASHFMDEMEVDVLDTEQEPLGVRTPHGVEMLNHSRLEVSCL